MHWYIVNNNVNDIFILFLSWQQLFTFDISGFKEIEIKWNFSLIHDFISILEAIAFHRMNSEDASNGNSQSQ